jgi:hypothetical protein
VLPLLTFERPQRRAVIRRAQRGSSLFTQAGARGRSGAKASDLPYGAQRRSYV